MAFDKSEVAAALDDNVEVIRSYLEDDGYFVERYQDAFRRLPKMGDASDLRSDLSSSSYPGALPTDRFDSADSLVIHHEASDSWDSHEAVNDWARDLLMDVPMLAVDGSEIPPTKQFNIPLAYVQAAWCLNHHSPEGRLERGREGRLLDPMDVTRSGGEDGDDEYRFVDSSLVGLERYEHEANLLIDKIEYLAERHGGGAFERKPVVLYDGPLVASFANPRRPEIRNRYLSAISELIAASQHHRIPLVGYIAGTNAIELSKMTRLLLQDELGADRTIPDARVLSGMMSPWGDSTVPFLCRRDGSVDALTATYRGEEYDFSHEIHFSYLKVPPGEGLDRLEFPGWLLDTDGPSGYESLYEYVLDVIRAEAGVGRGYPEVLQQADTDAVLDQRDRQQFLRLLQKWAETNDVPLEWDAKALSKELRRR
ncbi:MULTISPECIES: DNA double-strand break repair nuclease NurA [Haloferax]|uniref:NurA domain-containing protein n=2 Tax=Haloferax TaxID=2251 RepID=A0A6G1Z7F2_9EURY|nr:MULTISPECIES: DNA double-strand break repair nuclease NurA [Haloferax]KAB1184773.1 DNA double-strand break repair nuclease NurA [Haloferax sp. CBA1149]MRW82405.1 NurA domain-containing protein [Haloferax marinisediminis]